MKEQLRSETARAAVEKIKRKSYRELKAVLNFSFFCFKTKGQNNISRIILLKKTSSNKKDIKKGQLYSGMFKDNQFYIPCSKFKIICCL